MNNQPRVVLAPNPSPMTLDGTRTYIVGRERCVVIDPGPEDGPHIDAVAAEVGEGEVVAIIATHGHADHLGAGARLAERLGAPLRIPGPSSDLPAGAVALASGERIETDQGNLTVIFTPGHTSDHISLLWEHVDGTALFAGDLVLGEGDTALVASPEGDVADYLQSLARIEGISPGVLYPAHGPPLADPAAALQRFRDHRLKRVKEVAFALQHAPDAPTDRLVDAIYGKQLPAALREAAAGSIEAIREFISRSS